MKVCVPIYAFTIGEYTADSDTVKVDATIANDSVESKDVSVYGAFYKQDKLVDLQLAPINRKHQ